MKSIVSILLISAQAFAIGVHPQSTTNLACAQPVPATYGEHVQICQDHRPEFEAYYRDCLWSGQRTEVFHQTAQFARLEQLKAMFDLEIFYISRIPYTSPLFRKEWADFRARWTQRVAQNKALMDIDADPRMDLARCAFHSMVGLDCGGNPGIDNIGIKQKQAMLAANNASIGYQGPPSLVRDLLRARLTLQASNETVKEMTRDTAPQAQRKARQAKDRSDLKDYVFNMYPEFVMNNGWLDTGFWRGNLKSTLESVLQRNGVFAAFDNRIAQLESKDNLDISLKIANAGFVAKQRLTPTSWTPQEAQIIETQFSKSLNQILAIIDGQIKKASRSDNWVINQDYLVGHAADVALASGRTLRGNYNQAMICNNMYSRAGWKEAKTTLEVVGGGVALLTGVGAMFDVGAAATLGLSATSVGLINGISGLDLYSAIKDRSYARDMFYLRGGIQFHDLKDADKDLLASVPWVVLNAAFVAPGLVLEKIASATKLAQAANDATRVTSLNRYRRAVTVAMTAANAGVVVYNEHSAYLVIKETLKEQQNQERQQATGQGDFEVN